MPYYKSDKFSDMLAEQSSNDYQNRYHAKDMKTRSVRTSKSNENFLKTLNYPQQTTVINAQNNSINFQTSQYHHIQVLGLKKAFCLFDDNLTQKLKLA